MSKKYTLVKSDFVINWDGKKLYRIKAKVEIAALGIAAGTLGGYIEKEANLSQVSGDAWVYGNAWVYGVNLIAVRSDGYTFLVAPTTEGPRVMAGCRYFSFDEAEKHWRDTRGGTPLGDETFDILELLKKQAERHGFMEPVANQEQPQ